FRAVSLRIEGKTGRTLDGAIWLGSEVLTCETSHPRNRPHWWLVGNLWLSCIVWFSHRLRVSFGRELGGAHGRWVQGMDQFESEGRAPLREDQPELLERGGVRAPAVRLLFLVFVREHGFKRPARHIQGNHKSLRERA